MTERKKLTLREHCELGRKLNEANISLIEAVEQLKAAYPLKDEAYRIAVRADKAVEDLRIEMDGRFILEYPEDYSVFVYNGLEHQECD